MGFDSGRTRHQHSAPAIPARYDPAIVPACSCPDFVEHEDEFLPVKDRAQFIGDVKTFDGFFLDAPAGVEITDYDTALVWCESFEEFITATRYR